LVATHVAASIKVSSSKTQSDVVKQIEGFAFDASMTMGVGGFLAADTHPVLLFRNGDALKNVEGSHSTAVSMPANAQNRISGRVGVVSVANCNFKNRTVGKRRTTRRCTPDCRMISN
jgi:hypothetical protein